MTSTWDKAIEFVLRMEGAYTMDPHDPGGETNWGISRKAYPHLDIKNLTVDDAKKIYFTDYWAPCKCDLLPPDFAIVLMDTAVNQGVGKAIRLLQNALDVEEDGVIGPATLSAAKQASHRRLVKFLAVRLEAYTTLMVGNPNLLRYAINWYFRVLSLQELVLQEQRNEP